MRTTVLTSGLLSIAVLLTVSGCGASSPTPVPSPSATVVSLPTGDGVLRIGSLLPNKDSAKKARARAEVAAIELAVTEANRLGGFNGVPIETFHLNAGDLSTTAPEKAFDSLVASGVDVVIGPDDADLIARLAPRAAAAGVVLLSPTAHVSTAELVADADTGAHIVTLAPSKDGEAIVIASSIAASGGGSVVYLHDAEDGGFGDALTEAILGTGSPRDRPWYPAVGTMGGDVIAAADPAATAASVVALSPAAVVVSVADPTPVLEALVAAGVAPDQLWLSSADTEATRSQVTLSSDLAGVTGVEIGAPADPGFRALMKQSDPAVRAFAFAPEAYDATVLTIVAASVATSDAGDAIAATLQQVANVGYPCTSLGACLAVNSDGQDVNYVGVSGPVDLSALGNVLSGSYTLLRINDRGAFVDVSADEKVE
jgi:branched-chain amino acid transport system substrate-binding protein